MGPINDLAGRTFGRLTIPPRAVPAIRAGYAWWPCVCECGKRLDVRGTKLIQGRTVSCGCQRADPAIRRAARNVTTPRRRRQIARMGAAARWMP